MNAQQRNGSAGAEQEGELAARIGAQLTGILEQVSRLVEARAERARAAFIRRTVRIGLLVALGIVGTTLALVASLQFARGMSHGIAVLSGELWIGEFASGALLLALIFGVGLHVARRGKRPASAPPSRFEIEERKALDALQGSVSEIVREHPYASLGAALAAGFAAAPLAKGLLEDIGPLAKAALSRAK